MNDQMTTNDKMTSDIYMFGYICVTHVSQPKFNVDSESGNQKCLPRKYFS